MLSRIRNRQKGFTLIELLIVVAIIGIIAALLIPNFLDSLQKAKQKRTVADARNVGTAWMAWLTDQLQASSAGRSANEYTLPTGITFNGEQLGTTILTTRYIQQVPPQDGWKSEFGYFSSGTDPEDLLADQVMAIGSLGKPLPGETVSDLSGAYTTTPFDPTDYAQDIIWGDGFFVRWPQKTSS